MAHDKSRMSITRAEAADRLEQIALQLRNGSVSLGGSKVDVANEVEFEGETASDQTGSNLKSSATSLSARAAYTMPTRQLEHGKVERRILLDLSAVASS